MGSELTRRYLVFLPFLVSCTTTTDKHPAIAAASNGQGAGYIQEMAMLLPEWTGAEGVFGRVLLREKPKGSPQPVTQPPEIAETEANPLKLKLDDDFASVEYLIPMGRGKEILGPKGRAALAGVVKEAITADAVEIKGRAGYVNQSSRERAQKLAVGRAIAVRTVMVDGGVDQSKIRLFHLALNGADEKSIAQYQKVDVVLKVAK